MISEFNMRRFALRTTLTALAVSSAMIPARSMGRLGYVAWKDPLQGAFTMEVPAGWKVTGGMYQFAPVDQRLQVDAGSPDGSMHIQIGDARLTPLSAPGPSSQTRGLHEGQSYEVNGITYTILRSMNGAQFSRLYVQSRLAKTLTGLKIGESRDRPDVAQALGQPLQNGASMGATEFSFTRGGQTMRGACYARVEQNMGGTFLASPSVVLAPEGGMEAASQIALHMATHVRSDAQWSHQLSLEIQKFHKEIIENHGRVMEQLKASYEKCVSRINATADLWKGVLNPPGR